MSFLRAVWAVARKDLATEVRTGEMLGGVWVFSLLGAFVLGLALDLRGDAAREAAAGVLWATVMLAGTLGLNRSLAREQAGGCLDGLRLAPVDRSTILFGKAVGAFLVMGLAEVLLAPFISVLFGADLLRWPLLLVGGLGTLGYALVGTMLATVALRARAREVLLPVLLLPIAVPLLIACVRATQVLAAGGALAAAGRWLRLLVVYDLVMLAVAMLTFDAAVEE